MKKLFISVLLLFAASTAAVAAKNPEVEFNGIPVEFDQPAVIMQNRTMVPVRKIFELLGATVEWEPATRTVRTEMNGRKVNITIDKNEITVDGRTETIDAPARIVNNRTLVPLRAVTQSYGSKVEWDGVNGIASVFSDWYVNNEKAEYSDELFTFSHFADVEVIKAGGGVSLKSKACSMTITTEPSVEVTVNDGYIADLKAGIEKFPRLKLIDIRKFGEKNAVKFSCYNNERTIYYTYGYENGMAYNLALTVPVGAERVDAEKLMYSMNEYMKNR